VGDLHALRRARSTGGVDQRHHVVGLYRGPRRLEVEIPLSARRNLVERDRPRRRLPVDHHHLPHRVDGVAGGEHGVQISLLGDDNAACRVVEQMLDLLDGVGVVDREGRCPEVHHGGVGEVELGPVDEHQGHRVAATEPPFRQPGGEGAHALRVLAPGEADLVALGADRDPIGVGGNRGLEGLAGGPRVQPRWTFRAPPGGRGDLHLAPSLSR
jgi:hypothetical protein